MATTPRPPEPPSTFVKRRDEFLGILVIAAGLLLVASLVSYHPSDPSLFSSVAEAGARPRNWAGRFGASFSDGFFQFFGLAAAVLPLAILAVGVARFRSRSVGAWGTKAIGLVLTFFSVAPLAHLVLGRPGFFGGGLDAGGCVGDLLGSALVSALNTPGAAILLSASLLIGVLLATSMSLGEAIRALSLRLSGWWRARSLERARRREQEQKDKQRREVVKKHLQRAKVEGEAAAAAGGDDDVDEPGAEVVYIPSIT